MMSANLPPLLNLAAALLAAVAIATAARSVRALSASGAVAATAVGFLVFGFGGWQGAVALLLFFGTSTAASRFGKERKAALQFEKGSERDAAQVLANGGVAALCAALLLVFPAAPWLLCALLGSLAEANSDTWATEIGATCKRKPYMITTFQRAPTGASGAISLRGTAAAVVAALLISLVSLLYGLPPRAIGAVFAGGLGGSLFDSLLGATVQAQYRCPICEKLTERRTHCAGEPAVLVRGFAWLGNDAVNFLATLFGAAVSAVLSTGLEIYIAFVTLH